MNRKNLDRTKNYFYKNFNLIFSYVSIGIFAFIINYWTGSRGIFPIDSFVHFDSAIRIIKGEIPLRDYWIVHGAIVDYIQSLFFIIFGENWKAYLIHSSFFNAVIAIFSFNIFYTLKIKIKYALILSFCISILFYPVSGTPFLDIHSVFFSIISMYLIILFVKTKNALQLFFAIFLLGLAFFCKQVPSGYFIVLVSIFLVLYSLNEKNIKPILISFVSLTTFLVCLSFFLILNKIEFESFFVQLFLFPQEISETRFATYKLNIKNIFLDFKFIYLFLIPIIIIFIKDLSSKKNYDKKDFYYSVIMIFFTSSLIYHQIYTKNQIFIFFLIPLLCAFSLYLIEKKKNSI